MAIRSSVKIIAPALSRVRLALVGLCAITPCLAWGAEIEPFRTSNQSPLVQIFGLPAPENARVLKYGENRGGFLLDIASNFTYHSTSREKILIDGESVRGTLLYSRGFGNRYEAGVEIPLVSQSGGVFDGFIEGWHEFFHLPNGGRPSAPRNRLQYSYTRDGVERFHYTKSEAGIGDLRLTGGAQLQQSENWALALRGALKLPTGDSAALLGSGSTDLAVWLTGQRDFHPSPGKTALFGALGALGMSRGDVIPDQQRNLVGFGSLGVGWSPAERIAFKLQLSSHTPFYRGSDLPELSGFSTLLLMGGTVAFTRDTLLDIGVSEDVAVDRSPDVALHLGLTTRF